VTEPGRRAAELIVRDLRAGYGRTEVLHGVSVRAEPGECVTVLGRNGAGKSTLLNAIAGFVHVSGGSVELAGRDITRVKPHSRVGLGLSSTMEGHRVFHMQTVRDNLEIAAYGGGYGRSDKAREMSRVCELFPILAERFSQRASTLSGGQQQMLAIGQALMTRPSVLILDEPSAGLAPILVSDLFSSLSELAAERELTIVIVEQMVTEVLRISDRGYVLNLGEVVTEGSAHDLARDPAVIRAYIGQGFSTT
jgi:branched-chain amino acid transport system ATP-binding protein